VNDGQWQPENRMIQLKCTRTVLKHLGLRTQALAAPQPSEAPLGHWWVHQIRLGRRTAYLFMSEATLLSFVLLQGRKPVTVASLPMMFLGGLEQLLRMKGLPQAAIDRALVPCGNGAFAATDNRSDRGSLNDLAYLYAWIVEGEGGLARCDLTRLIMSTNDMPQRRLAWGTSWDAVRARLGLPDQDPTQAPDAPKPPDA
jgi:hypothetical protein